MVPYAERNEEKALCISCLLDANLSLVNYVKFCFLRLIIHLFIANVIRYAQKFIFMLFNPQKCYSISF
jgi:hypothetical protein